MKILITTLVVAGGMALGVSGQSGGTVIVKQDPVDRVMDSVVQMDRDRRALEIERQKLEVERERLRLEQERIHTLQAPTLITHNQPPRMGLFEASTSGNLVALKENIQYGKPINSTNSFGKTPLFEACRCGHIDIVQYLVKNGAAINIKDNSDDTPVAAAFSSTPLETAISRGYLDIVICLLDHGALLDYGYPLHRAAMYGEYEICKQLLSRGADVNARREYGEATPLMTAMYLGNIKIIELLLNKGADVNIKNSIGDTALHSLYGSHKNFHRPKDRQLTLADIGTTEPLLNTSTILSRLIEAGADVNAQNNNGITPLMLAAQRGHLESISLLLKSDADVLAQQRDGRNAEYYAATNGHEFIARFLNTEANRKNIIKDKGALE